MPSIWSLRTGLQQGWETGNDWDSPLQSPVPGISLIALVAVWLREAFYTVGSWYCRARESREWSQLGSKQDILTFHGSGDSADSRKSLREGERCGTPSSGTRVLSSGTQQLWLPVKAHTVGSLDTLWQEGKVAPSPYPPPPGPRMAVRCSCSLK